MMRKLTILSALIAAGIALPAQAHTKLVASTPAANATVGNPSKIVLTFNEKVLPQFAGAAVVMIGMPGMAKHAPMKISGVTSAITKDGKSMTLTMQRPLPTGTYQVEWHAAGADTHRMEGKFSFAVK
ncbi:copper homeostasis periplasmic binding protein CopC [Sphingomonas flavalba]|uniref:copper homeostasis periplasmic binding protein CopC n=1 Tax=Sphingomonas flavalba TaxID=2559804 RepID=UPI0039DFA5FC